MKRFWYEYTEIARNAFGMVHSIILHGPQRWHLIVIFLTIPIAPFSWLIAAALAVRRHNKLQRYHKLLSTYNSARDSAV